MTSYLGITNFIWLDGAFGGTLDITDMHIDGFAKFVDTNTIVTMNNSDLIYWGISTQDISILNSATNVNGNPYSFIILPLTQKEISSLIQTLEGFIHLVLGRRGPFLFQLGNGAIHGCFGSANCTGNLW